MSDTFVSKDRDKRVANLEQRCREKLGDGLFKQVRPTASRPVWLQETQAVI